MKKIIIWGTGKDFDKYYPYIRLEELKGNIEVCGVTSREEHLQVIGNYKFLSKAELEKVSFDYVVVAAAKFFDEICREALDSGIERERIIHPDVFMIPYFDFERYIRVKEAKISIVSNHCWGGLVYSLLKLPFDSPFINTLIDNQHYVRLISNLSHYLQQPLTEKGANENGAPICCLEDVEIQFIHHSSFEQAKRDWEKRINRINDKNIFVQMTIGAGEEMIRQFAQVNIENKIAFCALPYADKSTVFFEDWRVNKLRVKYSYMFGMYILDMVKPAHKISCPIDILKMLLGEEDFIVKR